MGGGWLRTGDEIFLLSGEFTTSVDLKETDLVHPSTKTCTTQENGVALAVDNLITLDLENGWGRHSGMWEGTKTLERVHPGRSAFKPQRATRPRIIRRPRRGQVDVI